MTPPTTRRRAARRPQRRGSRVPGWRRLADLALALAILGALALLAEYALRRGAPGTLSGTVRVADGDSLVMGAERIRLMGLDAPELAQTCLGDGGEYPCGREARDALARLVAGRPVSCESVRRDRYGRALARCVAGTMDINRAMVEAGWAVSYGDYVEAEAAARRAGRGMWAGSFERPQDWRRIHGGLVEDGHGWLADVLARLRGLLFRP